MPTGYTYKIEESDDFTFEDYLWTCARDFGAMVMMKDDPMDAPVPEAFRPSTHHADAIREANEELAELGRMSTEDVLRRIADETVQVERENEESRERHTRTDGRYAAMRARVESWEPPTPDHLGLKNFMLEQIDDSTRSGGPYLQDLPIADPAEWVADRRMSISRDLRYHMEYHAEDVALTNERNEWVRQLRASVPIGGRPKVGDGAAGASDGPPGGPPESWRDRESLL